jgi:hypothetical protein
MRYLRLLVCITTICTLVIGAAAAEPEKSEKVIVTGMGISPDKARQSAVRAAIEQVVGTYITSDTMVQNGQLIKDEILSHSGGYVSATRVLSTERSEDELYLVRIEATVVSTRLVRKLKDLNIATKAIDNKALFEAALSKIDTDRSQKEETATGGDVLEKILGKFPKAAYKFKIGEMAVDSANSTANKAEITIPIAITWDADFIDEFTTVLKKTQKDQFEFMDVFEISKRKYSGDSDHLSNTLCFSQKMNIDSLMPEYCSMIGVNRKALNDRQHVTNLVNFYKITDGRTGLAIKVILKNKSNKTLRVISQELPSDSVRDQGLEKVKSADGKYRIDSLYGGSGSHNNIPNTLSGSYAGVTLLVDGVYTIDVSDMVDLKILKEVTSIDVFINSTDASLGSSKARKIKKSS